MSADAKPTLARSYRYTCPAGHTMTLAGPWTTLHVAIHDLDGSIAPRDYNYCMTCFGEWAVRQWPLTCEELEPEKQT